MTSAAGDEPPEKKARLEHIGDPPEAEIQVPQAPGVVVIANVSDDQVGALAVENVVAAEQQKAADDHTEPEGQLEEPDLEEVEGPPHPEEQPPEDIEGPPHPEEQPPEDIEGPPHPEEQPEQPVGPRPVDVLLNTLCAGLLCDICANLVNGQIRTCRSGHILCPTCVKPRCPVRKCRSRLSPDTAQSCLVGLRTVLRSFQPPGPPPPPPPPAVV